MRLTSEEEERMQLARDRIREISEGTEIVFPEYSDFFMSVAADICRIFNITDRMKKKNYFYQDIEILSEDNKALFRSVLKDNYNSSYANPEYAERRLRIYAKQLSFLAAELVYLPQLIIDDKNMNVLVLLELFLEMYGLFTDETKPPIRSVDDAIFYFAFDYVEDFTADRLSDTLIPSEGIAYDIVLNEDFSNPGYLFKYGEYITDNEIKLSQYLNTLSDSEIDRMAEVYTDGFRRGFDTMRVNFEGKESVNIRYHIGEERIVKAAIKRFADMGLKPIMNRYAVNRIQRRGVIKQGFEAVSVNSQFEYDHRMDEALFLDGRYADRRINALEAAYEKLETEAHKYAGPAVIERFGEELFNPVSKDSVARLSEKQESISVDMNRKLSVISNKYIPGDEYSFTIIAFPLPEIGEAFEDIFKETMILNTLDNEKYTVIQQCIIDALDTSDYVEVKGSGKNETEMHVAMRCLEKPDSETQFENCVADVNIPLGEVFTSPVLKGTYGRLNVSSAYLNGYLFKNIKIDFNDGVITGYSCDNYDDMEAGKKYIKENILFNHDTLPIGEFAIGTNTIAYTMARKYDILAKLPILIVEKTGPHFAVGDTCYSHAEDKKVYNPNGKEIVSRENDFSRMRETDPEKAYFNCHTDITIPYNELEAITAVYSDGTRRDIIRDGRFVLPGTEELNLALD
jgi:Leucyl aminopeptidase (aminopeptidase T)